MPLEAHQSFDAAHLTSARAARPPAIHSQRLNLDLQPLSFSLPTSTLQPHSALSCEDLPPVLPPRSRSLASPSQSHFKVHFNYAYSSTYYPPKSYAPPLPSTASAPPASPHTERWDRSYSLPNFGYSLLSSWFFVQWEIDPFQCLRRLSPRGLGDQWFDSSSRLFFSASP